MSHNALNYKIKYNYEAVNICNEIKFIHSPNSFLLATHSIPQKEFKLNHSFNDKKIGKLIYSLYSISKDFYKNN